MEPNIGKQSSTSGKVIIDHESKIASTGDPVRGVMVVNYSTTNFDESVEKIRNTSWGPKVVQYINSETGETIKGPLYDKSELEPPTDKILDNMKSGVKQQKPLEDDMPHEPKDRFQENRNMSITKNKFKKLVQECMVELKEETKSPRERLKESLRPMVEKVLSEIANVKTKGIDDDEDEVEKVKKGFTKMPIYQKDPEIRLDKSNE